jgi:hypothetical protein
MKWLILLALCSCLDAQAPFERILHADAEPGNWLTYFRDLWRPALFTNLRDQPAERVASKSQMGAPVRQWHK